ncbi:hypothetical protein V865_002866 [Kwoniella europaea PYCC6329]|uniref:Uncharacterized protein n=1 Tax=Kwoniella europaea PYCC6329 TaxID=1423913 RepID=A0AAX4KH08_9TREE
MSNESERLMTAAQSGSSASGESWPIELTGSSRPRRSDGRDPHSFPSFESAMSATAELELSKAIDHVRGLIRKRKHSGLLHGKILDAIEDELEQWTQAGDKFRETLNSAQARTPQQQALITEWNSLSPESTAAEEYPIDDYDFSEQYRQLQQFDAERTKRLASAANKDDGDKGV